MPLVNCIPALVNHTLLLSLCYLLLKFAVYVPKIPLWVEAFTNPCEPESFHESYSSGASPDKISTLQLLRRREVNERLCIKEVGVDLELSVHAHGHDVDPIMEASCNNNYSFGISSSYIWDLAFCNRGSDHVLL